jgi:hypothetical protein
MSSPSAEKNPMFLTNNCRNRPARYFRPDMKDYRVFSAKNRQPAARSSPNPANNYHPAWKSSHRSSKKKRYPIYEKLMCRTDPGDANEAARSN